MSVHKPLLSIAIATKNRVAYCIQTIETILKYENVDFELVVQDNTDNMELLEYVKNNISDHRLVYNYTPPPFSSIDNFNAVLMLTKGKYVCLLGDDDGITQNIFKVVKWANENNVDSICPKVFIHYMWPNKNTFGKMVIPYSSHKIWRNNPLDNLQDLVDDGVFQYMKFNLPKLYHGIVQKKCLEEIKNKTGNYLGGLSPDIYASVSLSSVVKNHIVIDLPITIAGACPQSTTVESTKGKHSGRIEDAPHFRSRANYIWDKNIPGYYSVETIWAESALKALKENEISINTQCIDITKILASAINNAPKYKNLFVSETLKCLELENGNLKFRIKLYVYRVKFFLELFLKKVLYRIPRKYVYKQYRIVNISDIWHASNRADYIMNKIDLESILSSYKDRFRKV